MDNDLYTTLSLRHAATSLAAAKNLSLTTTLVSVGWNNESTFTTFYIRPMMKKSGSFLHCYAAIKSREIILVYFQTIDLTCASLQFEMRFAFQYVIYE